MTQTSNLLREAAYTIQDLLENPDDHFTKENARSVIQAITKHERSA